MFLRKLLMVTTLTLKGQNVWTIYVPEDFKQDIAEATDSKKPIAENPILAIVFVSKNNAPKLELHRILEDDYQENNLLRGVKNTKIDPDIDPIDYVYTTNGNLEIYADKEINGDPIEILRKRKKKKKKKNLSRSCKTACISATKTVCKKFECSKKNKKKIATKCLKKCKKNGSDSNSDDD